SLLIPLIALMLGACAGISGGDTGELAASPLPAQPTHVEVAPPTTAPAATAPMVARPTAAPTVVPNPSPPAVVSTPVVAPAGQLAIVSGGGDGVLEGELSLASVDGSAQRTIGPIGFLGSYDISPDGAQIVFANARTNEYAVYRAATAGGQPTLLTKGLDPRWSPDGLQIAYVGNDGDLYVMNADGSEAVRLTTGPGVQQPAWSPDGRQLAYIRCNEPLCTDNALAVVDVASHRQRLLAGEELAVASFVWSPDGTALAFGSQLGERGEIYRVNRDGSALTLLATDGAGAPIWSPDGTRIAFMTNDGATAAIFVMSADGSDQQRLVEGYSPSWSPDSAYLAISVPRGNGSEIATIRPDGSQKVSLADGYAPVWSPDGAYLAFVSDRADGPGIYVMRADGSQQIRVFEGRGSARWLPIASPLLKLTEPLTQGSAVAEAQQRLHDLGYAVGAIDGVYGPRTEAAVRQFQQDRHLVVDGIVGSNTWAALRATAGLSKSVTNLAPPAPARWPDDAA
ncbi:MAG TPA: peptidoglycan-binding protein, partial [Roseiflexaceae bacterium]|nr:peptidoglycan-binding protein [Roseiflexaceae bacterium]